MNSSIAFAYEFTLLHRANLHARLRLLVAVATKVFEFLQYISSASMAYGRCSRQMPREQRLLRTRTRKVPRCDKGRRNVFTLHTSHARVALDVRLPWVLSDMRRRFAAGESLDANVDEASVALHVLNISLTCNDVSTDSMKISD